MLSDYERDCVNAGGVADAVNRTLKLAGVPERATQHVGWRGNPYVQIECFDLESRQRVRNILMDARIDGSLAIMMSTYKRDQYHYGVGITCN